MAEFLCWAPSNDPHASRDDGVEVSAFDAWSAAKEYVRRIDQDSGSEIAHGALRGNYRLRVHVLTPDGVETLWDVWPEAEIHWYGSAAGVVSAGLP